MNNREKAAAISFAIALAFIIVIILSAVDLTIEKPIAYSEQAVQATIEHELLRCHTLLQVPTATVFNPTPCPKCTYTYLPDPEQVLIDMDLALISIVQAKKAMEEIMTMEGDYNHPPHTQAIVAINHLDNAYTWLSDSQFEVAGWWTLGKLTCPD
jgi:hypothetical protein